MVYYAQGMELEVISEVFRGPANDVLVCRDRLSASDAMYTLLAIHDRDCARTLLTVMESSDRTGEDLCLLRFAQNEAMLFLYPYREERKFAEFAAGQMTSPEVGEQIGINLVLECLTTGLPWPVLYLVLNQEGVQITQENGIYFTTRLDLSELKPDCSERSCAAVCAQLVIDLLSAQAAGSRRSRRKRLKSLELLQKKVGKNAYNSFPELYRDIRITALPPKRQSLMGRLLGVWHSKKDLVFRILLVLSVIAALIAGAALVTEIIFGDIPWLRLFRNTFDVIGTENLHRGGSL